MISVWTLFLLFRQVSFQCPNWIYFRALINHSLSKGSDTTSGVLTFVFYYLLTNKEAYNRLRAELDETFPDYDAPLNREILMNLPYLSAVVEESLRLGTPFPGLPRVTPEGGATLAGEYIPEGTIVGVPAYSQAIHPENFWPEPEAFRPERWLPEGLGPGSRVNKQAVLSFSWGSYLTFIPHVVFY